jgi:CDGSH-type Zn-finger protein
MVAVTEVIVTDDGPVLITGPVEIVLPDGTRVRSERPVTALCVCRRSRRAPFCDTSHRRKVRTTASPPGTTGDAAPDGATTPGTDEENRAQPHRTAAR